MIFLLSFFLSMAGQNAPRLLDWGANKLTTLVLSASYQLSNPFSISFVQDGFLFVSFKSKTSGSTLQYQVWTNPYSEVEDPLGQWWAKQGFYVDSSGNQTTNSTGSWVEQVGTYNSVASSGGTINTYVPLVPMKFDLVGAKQFKIGVKETGGTSAGDVQFVLVKNSYY